MGYVKILGGGFRVKLLPQGTLPYHLTIVAQIRSFFGLNVFNMYLQFWLQNCDQLG